MVNKTALKDQKRIILGCYTPAGWRNVAA